MLQISIKKQLKNFILDVDLTMEKELLGLLGASGAGKSMLLKCIAGIETPDSGRILLGDRILFDSEKHINLPPQKRKIGYLFQDYALFPHMTVRENIKIACSDKKDVQRTDRLLKQFQITDVAEEKPAKLSGGQKQRAAMARLFAADPQVILLDEPFSALDSYLRELFVQELGEQLRQISLPVIMVSHDRNEIFRMCDQVGCMERGKLIEQDSVEGFFTHPMTMMGARLAGFENLFSIKDCERAGIIMPVGKVCAGIRAYAFSEEQTEDSIAISICQSRIVTDFYEDTLFFKIYEGSQWYQWKRAGMRSKRVSMPVLSKLYVSKKDILWFVS